MCGIAGIVGDKARDPSLLAAMSAELAHRGPDDQGIWTDTDAGVALVHRRLAIVDLSPAGHQPMLSGNGRFVLTFNGEIYNHSEIRAELEAEGAVPSAGWRGHSDTETFLEAICSWGLRAALERSVGMFAFGLWDRETRTLSLVRDRFGEKPLYYGWAGRDFVFGSELKAFRPHPQFAAEIDRRALELYVRRNYVAAPLSIYRGVFKLEPASILELDLNAARQPLTEPAQTARYWSYRETLQAGLADPIREEEAAVEELERSLAAAIKGQSLADVPVGAFLSGGIDSSTVVALYQKYSPRPVRTFTIGFREERFNEADDARAVAKQFGTEHHDRIVTPSEAMEVIPKLPWLYDEPFADSSQIPTHLVSAFAREQVKVALSGDGGDELFGGYNRYFTTARLWSAMEAFPAPLRSAFAASLAKVPAGVWDRVADLAAREKRSPYFGIKAQRSFRSVAAARSLEQLMSAFLDEWREGGSPVLSAPPNENAWLDLDPGDGAAPALRMMYCDAVSYLPDDILCKVDRAAMGVGLETRVPFLDQRVAAVAARIPLSMKVRGGVGKRIVRNLLYREAPRELFERPKAGFAVPVGEWIKAPLRDWAEDLLDEQRLRNEGWFDAAAIRGRWREHLDGKRDSTAALWSILMFEEWRKSQTFSTAAAA